MKVTYRDDGIAPTDALPWALLSFHTSSSAKHTKFVNSIRNGERIKGTPGKDGLRVLGTFATEAEACVCAERLVKAHNRRRSFTYLVTFDW